ncbi:unnamed protein product, partial [Meganyctiphanes norvegica]
MGKKRDKTEAADEQFADNLSVPVSKPKKSKKHKRDKKPKSEDVDRLINIEDVEEMDVSVDDVDESPTAELKFKIKLEESYPEKQPSTPKSSKVKVPQNKSSSSKKPPGNKKKEGKGEDDTDSEEERWLHAIESGKLEEVDDELKRMRNPRLMTARQRALLEKRTDAPDENFPVIPAEPLMALPSGFKEKVVTEEMLAKKAIKTQKRREQAQEKREEDKKRTIDRLLKKQESKAQKIRFKCKQDLPMLTYLNTRELISVSFPTNCEIGIKPAVAQSPPKVVQCGAPGCSNPKKYCCSKTGVPLCSLQCYKSNMKLYLIFI